MHETSDAGAHPAGHPGAEVPLLAPPGGIWGPHVEDLHEVSGARGGGGEGTWEIPHLPPPLHPWLPTCRGMTVHVLASRFVHPRFGPIKCIRSLRAVEADEELTVAYGYDHSPPGKSGPEAPEWYQVELKAFQAAQQK